MCGGRGPTSRVGTCVSTAQALGFLADRSPFASAGAVPKVVGEVSRTLQKLVSAIDRFVGKYLAIVSAGYIALKFVHLKWDLVSAGLESGFRAVS